MTIKKVLKVLFIVLGVILAGVIILALINLKSILLTLGIGKLDVKSYDEAESSLKQSDLYTGTKMPSSYSTKDGVVDLVIQGVAGGTIKKVDAKIHGGMLENIDPTNVTALEEKAKAYLSPVISDDQVLGLSGFIAKEALAQYNQGNTQIKIQKNFNGVSVAIEGDIDTREFTVKIVTKP